MSDVQTMTREEAYEAGRQAVRDNTAQLHDLTGQMRTLGIPTVLQGRWLAGVEDELADEGFDVEGPEGDGYDWERQALSRIG